jgi:hypothetical protein
VGVNKRKKHRDGRCVGGPWDGQRLGKVMADRGGKFDPFYASVTLADFNKNITHGSYVADAYSWHWEPADAAPGIRLRFQFED